MAIILPQNQQQVSNRSTSGASSGALVGTIAGAALGSVGGAPGAMFGAQVGGQLGSGLFGQYDSKTTQTINPEPPTLETAGAVDAIKRRQSAIDNDPLSQVVQAKLALARQPAEMRAQYEEPLNQALALARSAKG